MLKKINYVFLIIGHNKNPADRIFNLWAHKYTEQIKACHSSWKFKDLWIVCFSQPVLPWLQWIWGRGVDHFQWLIVEWGTCSFDQKGQKSIWILCCPASAKNTSSRDATSLCFGARKCNSNKCYSSDFFAVAAVQAGWGIVKCGKKKQRQQLQDSKIIQVEREKIHGGCCLLLWVELLLPSRQEGSFEGLTMPHSMQ